MPPMEFKIIKFEKCIQFLLFFALHLYLLSLIVHRNIFSKDYIYIMKYFFQKKKEKKLHYEIQKRELIN